MLAPFSRCTSSPARNSGNASPSPASMSTVWSPLFTTTTFSGQVYTSGVRRLSSSQAFRAAGSALVANVAAGSGSPAGHYLSSAKYAPYESTSDGAIKAAEFYKRAFGAEEVARVPPDDKGRTMHVHLYVNGGSVMLSDAYPEHGHPWKEPQGFNLHLQVDDVDKWWDRAVKAGAEVRTPVQLMFWGDRYGQVRDPFGIVWGIATTPKPKK